MSTDHIDRHDVETAFQLLDIIQGHPGYTAYCFQCGEPMTDNLGNTLDPSLGFAGDSQGIRHNALPWDDCPIYMEKVLAENRERIEEIKKRNPDYESQLDFLRSLPK